MLNVVNTAVISAGGLGSRLQSITKDKPKALVEFLDEPLIVWQIKNLYEQGFKNFILLLGYGSDEIINCINSLKLKGNFKFIVEEKPLGNGGALLNAYDRLPDQFLYLYCDIIFDIDFGRFIEFHNVNAADLTLFVHPNNHPFDSDQIILNRRNEVQSIHNPPHKNNNIGNNANAAVYLVNKNTLGRFSAKLQKRDFIKDIVSSCLQNYKVMGYRSAELVKDIGTESRYNSAIFAYHSRLKSNDNPVVFLDRDGTLNQHKAGRDILSAEELKLLPNVGKSLKLLKEKGYFLVIVTNQPCIAKGFTGMDDLFEIHNKLEFLLGESGAYVDAIYTCYHHPEKGFAGEVPELKIDCSCRKPETGLLQKASEQIPVNKATSWMVGDTWRDILAGQRFEVNTCLLSNEKSDELTYDADVVLPSIYEFALMVPDMKSESS